MSAKKRRRASSGTGKKESSTTFSADSKAELAATIPVPPRKKQISLKEITASISADFDAHQAMVEAAASQEAAVPEEIVVTHTPKREISIADLADEISAKMERRELAEKTANDLIEKVISPTPDEMDIPQAPQHELKEVIPELPKEHMNKDNNKIPTSDETPEEKISEPVREATLAEEILDPHAGEKYVDSQTKQHWADEDHAFEERRKRRAEARLARQEAMRKARRRRNLTIVAVLLLVCAAAFAFAWSQGYLNHGTGSQPADTPASSESLMETEAPTQEAVPATEEASVEEASSEAVTTEAEHFDQSTEATGMEEAEDYVEPTNAAGISPADPVSFFNGYDLDTSDAPEITNEEIDSPNAILVDLDTGEVIAQRGADTIISPASMTKILTVLVAAEHLVQEDLDDEVTIDTEILDYVYLNGCTVVGFEEGETVTVRDLFYGTILPSGADAALALAKYVAGSQEAFVRMMNEKLDRMGLSDTAHFTNCVGLYNEDHYCTVADMAMIMKAAATDNYARQILAKHVYTTTATEQHPEGLTISNWFLRRIEDKDSHGTVLCAKTGFVNESGNCAASFCVGNDGKNYACVTAGTYSSWRCIYDHAQIYTDYIPG